MELLNLVVPYVQGHEYVSNETKSIIGLVQVFMCVLTCALNAVASLYI